MSNSHPETPGQPSGAFSAADLMRELAQVSETPLDTVAPGLVDVLRADSSSEIDRLIAEINEKPELTEVELKEQHGRALKFLGDIAEITHGLEIPQAYRDQMVFDVILKRFPYDVSPIFLQYVLDHPGDMEHMVEGDIKANEARAAIGIWLSVLMRRLPEAPEGEEPEPVTLTLPPELISGYGSDKMTCFGSQFDGNRDVTVVGNPGNTAATGMHGGRLTIQADSLQNSATWMVGGKLTIDGDFAVSPGFQMSGGEIVVKGSVDKQAGWQMSNGTITIEGDGGNQVGFTMTGGEIHVLGNTDESTGYRMTGGTIKVDGDIGGWSYSLVPGFMSSGTIISKFGSVNEKYFLKDGEVQEL